jgi:hypothetical protein
MAFFNATLSEADLTNIFRGIAKPQDVVLSVSLSAGGSLLIEWPVAATGYTLQTSSALGSAASWGPAGLNPVVVDGMNQVTVPIGSGTAFYRLIK